MCAARRTLKTDLIIDHMFLSRSMYCIVIATFCSHMEGLPFLLEKGEVWWLFLRLLKGLDEKTLSLCESLKYRAKREYYGIEVHS